MKVLSFLQSNKFTKGEGNLQLAAEKELCKQGIECDDSTKAVSKFNSNNNPMRNPVFATKKAAAQMGALNVHYRGDKWSNDEVKHLHKLFAKRSCVSNALSVMILQRR